MPRTAVPLLVGLATALSGVALLASQVQSSQQVPVFRSSAELVHVDVVVLDERGNPVRGLTADDFTLLDGRRPQPVAAFSEVAHLPEAPGQPVPPADVPRDVGDNTTDASERVVLLVIDDLNLWQIREDRVKDIAHRVVRQLGPSVSFSVLFTSGRGSVEITDDRAAIHEAIDSLEGTSFFFRASGTCTPRDIRGCYLLKTIQDAARMMGAEDQRRRAVIVISEWQGIDVRPLYDVMTDRPAVRPGRAFYDFMGDYERFFAYTTPYHSAHGGAAMLQMLGALRASNVTFYGIDPRQYAPTEEEIAREHTCAEGGEDPRCGAFVQQLGLKLTAEATGGFALIDRDRFDADLTRLATDLDNYYLLGFYPEDPADPSWRNVTVQVNRPDVQVRHRAGYRLDDVPALPENEDPLVGLSAGLIPNTGLPMRLFAAPVARAGREARVAVTTEIRVPAGELVQPDGSLQDMVALKILAVDLDRKKVTRTADHEATVVVPASAVRTDGDVTYQVVVGIDLPPAAYQLRVSAQSAAAGAAGSVYLMTRVPDVRDERIAIAGPWLSDGEASGLVPDATQAEAGLLPAGVEAGAVLARIFTPGDRLRAHYQVWPRDPDADVVSRLTVVDAAGQVVFTREAAAATQDGLTVDLPLATLAPGAYTVRITASAGEYRAEQTLGFAVRSAR